jgi:hypothetical protein
LWRFGIIAKRFTQFTHTDDRDHITHSGTGPDRIEQFFFRDKPTRALD